MPAVARAVWRVGATRPARADQNLRAFKVKSNKGLSMCNPGGHSERGAGRVGSDWVWVGAVWVAGDRCAARGKICARRVPIGGGGAHFRAFGVF